MIYSSKSAKIRAELTLQDNALVVSTFLYLVCVCVYTHILKHM